MSDPLSPPNSASARRHATRLTAVKRDDEAEAKQRPLDRRLILRLWRYSAPHARMRNTLLVIVLIRAVQLPAIGWWASQVINGPVFGRDWPGVVRGAAVFFALVLFTEVTHSFRTRLSLKLGEAVVQDLRRDIFVHLQRLSMPFYDRTKVGRIISRITSDAEAMRMGIQDVLFVSLVQGGGMVVAAGVMLWYDPPLFGFVAAMTPIIYLVNRWFTKRLSTQARLIQESMSRVTATIAESVSGVRVTQGFVRQEVNAGLFRDLVRHHANHNLAQAKLSGTQLPLLEFKSQFIIAALTVLAGWQVLHGGFFAGDDPAKTFGALVVFWFMISYFFSPIRVIAEQYNTALTAMAGAERVFGLLDQEPERLDAEDAVAPDDLVGRVEFANVHFGYDADHPVLHGVSFAAEPGQTVALVGHTGSGKSTVIKLICKFYLPTHGQVLIDGIESFCLDTDALMSRVGIVLQSNFLFTGSVMDNIRLGRPDAADDEVVDAARRLDCLDLLEALPGGLLTEVGEKGGNLSLGQRQLVCFCRAMLADPRILILDEATSSVDTMTEARIQKALEVLLEGRTSFVVAHRLSTIRHADTVLVLDHGVVVERGSHNDLLAVGGVYANLYRQFIHATEA
ncbi:MAG: ABC transporter ATP-binding protein [Planctomycetota bacterium]